MKVIRIASCVVSALLAASVARSEFLVDDFSAELPPGTALPHSAEIGRPPTARTRTISVSTQADVVSIGSGMLGFQGQSTESGLSIVYAISGPTAGPGLMFRNTINAITIRTGGTNSFAKVGLELVTHRAMGGEGVSRLPESVQMPMPPGQSLTLPLDSLVQVGASGVDMGNVHELRFTFTAPGARLPLGAPFVSLDLVTADWLRHESAQAHAGWFSANWASMLIFLIVVLAVLFWLRSRGRKAATNPPK
jgi:hypothetical protein